MKRIILVYSILSICCNLLAQSIDNDESTKHLIREAHKYRIGINVEQNYEKAFNLFSRAAQMGSAKATHAIGMMYQNGWGCDKNNTKAVEIYQKAAELGYAQSYYNLAMLHKHGQCNLPVDYKLAYENFLSSAKLGYTGGMYGTGYMLYRGLGCQQNYTEAFTWFTKGAELGRPSCMYQLGLCYRNGYGTHKNTEEAKYWLKQAAKKGYNLANDELNTPVAESKQPTKHNSLKSTTNSTVSDTLNTFKKIANSTQAVEISGVWAGEKITYDFSGKHIVKKENINLQIKQQGNSIQGNLTESDSLSIPLLGTIHNNQLLLTQGNISRAGRYGNKYKWQIQQANFVAERKEGQIFLVGNIQEYTPQYHEPGMPSTLVLHKLNESTQDPLSNDSNLLAKVEVSTPKLIALPKATNAVTKKSIHNTHIIQPSALSHLPKIYPNPFKNQFTLEYNVPEEGKVQIELYNMQGSKVKVLQSAVMQKGHYNITGGEHLQVGTYVISILHKGKALYQSTLIIKQP